MKRYDSILICTLYHFCVFVVMIRYRMSKIHGIETLLKMCSANKLTLLYNLRVYIQIFCLVGGDESKSICTINDLYHDQ